MAHADGFESWAVPLLLFSSDYDEPRHVHVERDDRIAKFWLDPVRLQSSGGFSQQELARIRVIIEQHQDRLRKAWDAYFNG